MQKPVLLHYGSLDLFELVDRDRRQHSGIDHDHQKQWIEVELGFDR
jgi:hypothetical protein